MSDALLQLHNLQNRVVQLEIRNMEFAFLRIAEKIEYQRQIEEVSYKYYEYLYINFSLFFS